MSNWAPGAVALVFEELGLLKRFVLLINFQFSERGERLQCVFMENLERLREFFECFSLLINGGSVASISYALKTLPFMVGE